MVLPLYVGYLYQRCLVLTLLNGILDFGFEEAGKAFGGGWGLDLASELGVLGGFLFVVHEKYFSKIF